MWSYTDDENGWLSPENAPLIAQGQTRSGAEAAQSENSTPKSRNPSGLKLDLRSPQQLVADSPVRTRADQTHTDQAHTGHSVDRIAS